MKERGVGATGYIQQYKPRCFIPMCLIVVAFIVINTFFILSVDL